MTFITLHYGTVPQIIRQRKLSATVMESPVGTTYELRSHSLLPVGPRLTDKADSCGELTTAVITATAALTLQL